MACIVEPQELILEQTMLYVFCLFLSPLWSDVFVFWKKWFLQKLQQNLQNFDFFSSNLFKKNGIKIFFFTFFHGLKFYMRISECICKRIMMKKKYRFFDPFTGEAPLNSWFYGRGLCMSILYSYTDRQIISKFNNMKVNFYLVGFKKWLFRMLPKILAVSFRNLELTTLTFCNRWQ